MKKKSLFVLLLLAVTMLIASGDLPDFKKIIENRRLRELDVWSTQDVPSRQNRPEHNFDALHYDIDITLLFETLSFQVDLTADFEILEDNVESITLHCDDAIQISGIQQSDQDVAWSHEDGALQVNLLEPAQTGEIVTLRFDYSAQESTRLEDGLKYETHSGVPVAFTMCSPRGARKWLISYDLPDDKIEDVDLWITYPEEYSSAAIGLLQETIDNGDGTVTDHWYEAYPVCSYLISLAVTNYELHTFDFTWEGQTMPVMNYVYPESADSQLQLFNQCGDMLTFFSSIYGVYPFLDEKYGHAVCTNLGATAMEHQTCTSYNPSYINEEDAPYTVAHELSHHWGGDCLSISDWSHVWLKEGFASYSEALWAESLYGSEGLIEYMEAFDTGSQLDPSLYRDPEGTANEIFNWTIYAKGAWAMHMLRGVIRDEDFFQTIAGILEDPDFRYGNFSTDDLMNYAEDVSGIELDWFFDCWYPNEGRPRYDYTVFAPEMYFPEMHWYSIAIQSQGTAGDEFTMRIPIRQGAFDSSILVEPGANYIHTGLQVSGWNVEFDPDSWVLDGGFTERLPILNEIPRRDGKVMLVWDYFFDDMVEGYWIFRSNGGEFSRLNEEPLEAISFLDEDISPDSLYAYKICAVLSGSYSDFSNTIVTQPIDYSFNRGILVVDNTMDYSSPTLPTDEEMDEFYDDLMRYYAYDTWDVSDQGYPPLSEMGRYSTIIWHADDIQQSPIVDDIYRLQNYSLAGGKLIISQCKKTSAMQPSELESFFGIDAVYFNNQPDFVAAISQDEEYVMDIPVDTDRLPLPNWTNALGYVSRFDVDESTEVIFRYDSINDDPAWEGQPCGIWLHDPEIVLLGFPLYHMMEFEAEHFMQHVLHEFGELEPAVDDQTAPACEMEVKLYPNPFNPELNISFMLDREGETSVSIYNVRGELVRKFEPERLTAGRHTYNWGGRNSAGNLVSSGVYFVRVHHDGVERISKALLIK